ncbi:MAG: HAMP domain-containing sensor histidine kinase [Myxococcota bacterium]|nr:HAMP domain-containing sensor histidine kinase [Myxococcota bacterium]
MKIRTKIVLLFTLGAIVPLLLSHFFATRMVSAAIQARITENLAHSAEQAAGRIGDHLERSIKELSLIVDAMPFENFSADDLHRALEIPYRQLHNATTIALLDEKGAAVTPPFTKPKDEALALGREPVFEEDLAAFERHVPLRLAQHAEVAIGPVYLSAAGTPRMVMARSYPLEAIQSTWVLAAEVSLSEICGLIAAHDKLAAKRARIIDALGRDICGQQEGNSPTLPRHSDLQKLRKMQPLSVSTYVDANGRARLGVVDEVGVTGWLLLLEQSKDSAMAPVTRSLYWIALWVLVSLGVALGGGIILARELTRPIAELEQAAMRIADGDYQHKLDLTTKDEVGHLASAFNRMTTEIRAWNAELTERVEERTRALREAREQIMQTQKLAAIGELGSGVAHEINNPLTGVIGVAQLLQGIADPDTEISDGLKDIIKNARRVADIVDTLLKFSQTQVSPEMQSIDAGHVTTRVLDLFANRLSERSIKVATEISPGCHVFARENDLRLALNHVIDNAVRAVSTKGHIGVVVKRVEGSAVLIAISDNGPGMPEEIRTRAFDPFFTTSNPGSSARGLGLPLVHHIVNDHKGRVVIDSTLGEGTRLSIYLPGAVRLSRA